MFDGIIHMEQHLRIGRGLALTNLRDTVAFCVKEGGRVQVNCKRHGCKPLFQNKDLAKQAGLSVLLGS
jgi:hypothetical protein